jgi:predicted MFS family arabinose efflux permease
MRNDHIPDHAAREHRNAALRVLTGGMLGMMVVMGIGRFAYTPILPLMEHDLGMTHAVAGWLASMNYLGYLAGALGCALFPRMLRSGALNVGALLASIATTLLMGVGESAAWWGLLRGIGGFVSAVLFVVISVEVAEALARHGYTRWLGSIYGGIGLGIVLSGSVVPMLGRMGGWRGAWFGMGGFAAVLALAGISLAHKRKAVLAIPDGHGEVTENPENFRLLAAAYFFEGLGYIVSATFLVVMIARTPGLESFAPLSWVAVGIAAAPSTIFWQQLSRRIGLRSALMLAHAAQASGILISVWAHTAFQACLAAALFGGTFLGIVTLVMTEGNRRAGKNGRRVAAVLTTCFSVGQVIGPPLAGLLADSRGGFTLPLVGAAVSVGLGLVLIALDKGFQRHTY